MLRFEDWKVNLNIMAIRIPPKYGSRVPEPDQNQPKGSIFDRLNAKLKFERENIEPFLGENFGYYDHRCILYIGGEYVGKGYGNYTDKTEKYQEIGQILATL